VSSLTNLYCTTIVFDGQHGHWDPLPGKPCDPLRSMQSMQSPIPVNPALLSFHSFSLFSTQSQLALLRSQQSAEFAFRFPRGPPLPKSYPPG